MKIIGEKSLASAVKILLDLIFLSGIGILLSLPVSVRWYLAHVHGSRDERMYYFLLGLLAITGILALGIVREIRRIFNTLNGKDPFIIENVKSLKHMGIFSFAIAFCYGTKIFFLNSFFTIIILMIFVIAGFFSIILAEVFRKAVEVKVENDYTI
ncbi:DUF2975 domain-containing protein [Geosporobacter ferrireducens]|uniref:DUF2975 domain-containing protein n=1 Tax=Geosporobacter ferrireducens TaxID=1424294 RepID=A0A1D8GES1_9FIRM|nr:DUF2975 domain-containing protein [Geosporobacter ferrireducens]AOT69390.1 hypothetical protein Gferi_07275 [Geosporobacter ferrireducens]